MYFVNWISLFLFHTLYNTKILCLLLYLDLDVNFFLFYVKHELLVFVPALLLSILTPLFLPSLSVSLSYFIFAVPMHECFPIAILNGTFFHEVKCPCFGQSFAYENLIIILLDEIMICILAGMISIPMGVFSIPAGAMCIPTGTIWVPMGTISNQIPTGDTFLWIFLYTGVNYLLAQINFCCDLNSQPGVKFLSYQTAIFIMVLDM